MIQPNSLSFSLSMAGWLIPRLPVSGSVTPAPATPPWRQAPLHYTLLLPSVRTPAFPRHTHQRIIGLTWTQSPVYCLSYICQFPISVLRCCIDCRLSLCIRVLTLFLSCSTSVPSYISTPCTVSVLICGIGPFTEIRFITQCIHRHSLIDASPLLLLLLLCPGWVVFSWVSLKTRSTLLVSDSNGQDAGPDLNIEMSWQCQGAGLMAGAMFNQHSYRQQH